MRWLKPIQDFGEMVESVTEFSQNNYCFDEKYFLEHSSVRNVTIQLTEDCNCACTYCYQGNKTKSTMTKEVGRQIVDYLFEQWYHNETEGFINRQDTKGIILDFIGGEPLLNIDVATDICDYFWERCLLENHPWLNYWSASFSSNGSLYFDKKFQNFLKTFKGHVSYSITVDGPKEIHNACRVYKNSNIGNFDDAYNALVAHKKYIDSDPGTKITISPDNLDKLNTIVDFFFNNDIYIINANVIYENEWTVEQSKIFYKQLKQLSDILIKRNKNAYVSLFDATAFMPLDPNNIEQNRNSCGGAGAMLAFDPLGKAYPCLRYMSSSLGTNREPIVIGDCKNGIYKTPEQLSILNDFKGITRRSQSTDECFYCPIARGCSWCSAWNYQETGTPNCRSTRICNTHKARSLANVYFWNKYYLQEDMENSERMYFHRYLSDEESLKFISQEELDMLNNLENQAKKMSNGICCNKYIPQ